MSKKHRVIQWTTGRIGATALTGIIEHPNLELVGVYCYSGDKEATDAGQLCHTPMPATGVTATADIDALLALNADCVCYTPRIGILDEVCRILESGKNLVTPTFLFYTEEYRQRIRTACERGGASVYSVGVNPGIAGCVLPLALSAMTRHIDRVSVHEQTNWSDIENPNTISDVRFGRPPEEVALEVNEAGRAMAYFYRDQLCMLAEILGAELDDIVLEQDLVVATRDNPFRTGVIAKGTVCGQRYRWLGRQAGKTRVEVDCLFTVGQEYPQHWPQVERGFTVVIEGVPSIRAHLYFNASYEREMPMEAVSKAANTLTAMLAVNAIPNVCEAPAGILTPPQAGLVIAGRGLR
ncbi:MAG TPA: hypothetical protein VGL34_25850 [Steroidobacteraceae bacterium]|jgi:hypothetical protein